jgi:hypothetical protein
MKSNKYIFLSLALLFHSAVFAQSYRYEGYIQLSQKNQVPITLKLNVQGLQITGAYYYTKVGSLLTLEGSMLPNKDYELRETNEKKSVTGYFTGNWDGDKQVVEGKWLSPDRKSVHKTALKKVPVIQYNLISKSDQKKQGDTWHRAEKAYTIAVMQDNPNPTVQANFNKLMENLKVDLNITEAEVKINYYANNEVKIVCATDEFVSYQIVRHLGGEGIGNKELHSFHTFDLNKGEEIHLKDIFVVTTDSQKWLDPLIDKWQTEMNLENGRNGTWHLMLMQSSLQMLFTDTGNEINFDEIQYQPITIPYSEVRALIDTDSALGKWLKMK